MMESFVINGGVPLFGEVEIRGSKNAAPKLMLASLLTSEPCVIKNVPLSLELDIARELCERIGSKVEIDTHTRECRMTTSAISNSRVLELSRKNRLPILAFGPLLHRTGIAEIPVLEGCPIGHRPINLHLKALKKMGVFIQRRAQSYYASAKEIIGADIHLAYPSVGATENILLTAVLAKGKTSITNAAIEPEIINVISMVNAMGAKVSYDIASRTIKIQGVKTLHGVNVVSMPDRNEIIAFASAALATKGDILIRDINADHIEIFLAKVSQIGGSFEITPKGIRFWGKGAYQSTAITTAPHPGFMTDWQQPFCVVLIKAHGGSTIHETVYEDRLGYIKDLARMGANIEVTDECIGERCRFFGKHYEHSAVINRIATLKGTDMTMSDIRAGTAQIIASLCAKGTSTIREIHHIQRGYENFDGRLKMLGARIKRISNF